VSVYIYPTDRDWYRFLSNEPGIDEVNFWRPGGKQSFRQLKPGDLFLFRLGKPDNAIAGGGIYTHFSFAPVSRVWDAFQRKNGAADYETFQRLIARYKKLDSAPDQSDNAIIGCIVLTAPFFLPRNRWIPIPSEYEVNSPQGQRFDDSSKVGAMLIDGVRDALRVPGLSQVFEFNPGEVRFGESIVKRRLGQGGFALVVADAYDKRCAVSGERTYPVLESAHIKPVSRGGYHAAENGLLLRSDIHKLFDGGYVTIRPNGKFAVSPRLRDDWHNGRIYYDLDQRPIRLPTDETLRPDPKALEWHNDVIFKR